MGGGAHTAARDVAAVADAPHEVTGGAPPCRREAGSAAVLSANSFSWYLLAVLGLPPTCVDVATGWCTRETIHARRVLRPGTSVPEYGGRRHGGPPRKPVDTGRPSADRDAVDGGM